MQYVCSLRTILKICAKYVQFAHNPQDKKKERKKYSTGAFNVVWSQTPTAIQEDLLYVQLHCLK